MRSKLIAACLGLAAFVALAVMPAMASATNKPLLVEGKTTVPVGTKILATNIGETEMVTSLGTIKCSTATMTGEVKANTTGNVQGDITSAVFGGTGKQLLGAPHPECTTEAFLGGDTTVTTETGTNGLPWCISANSEMKTHEFQVRGNKCSGASRPIRFALDITNIGTCVYERSTAIPGSFTTSEKESVLSISGVEFPRISGPFGCPSSGKLKMSFKIETHVSPFTTLGIVE
jgi:hypothetical protein